MSIHVSASVWALTDLPPTEKLVLLKLADCADDEGGNAWPSVATLGRACGNLSVRAVHKVLVKLKQRGLLEVQAPAGTRHKTVTYRVTVSDPPLNSRTPVNPRTPMSPRSHRGELQDRGTPEPGGTGSLSRSSYDPSLNRPSEPLTNPTLCQEEQRDLNIQQFRKTFGDLYRRHRNGCVYRWAKRDSVIAEQLLARYGAAALVEMSEALLTLPSQIDEWVSKSDRSIAVLNHRANFLSNLVSSRVGGESQASDAWSRVLRCLAMKLSTWDFLKWFGPTSQIEVSVDGRFLYVSVEDSLHRRWVLDHYSDQLRAALAESGVPMQSVHFVERQPDASLVADNKTKPPTYDEGQ